MDRSSSHAQQVPGTVTSPAPEKASVWEDFLDIFYAPATVFARRENGSFLIPMLVVTLLLGVLYYVNSRVLDPIMEAEMRRQMAGTLAKNPQITPEMLEQSQGMMKAVGGVFAVIGIPIVLLVIGFTLWLVGKMFGAQQTFRAAMVVAAYSYVPRILESVLAGVQGFFVDPAQLDGRYRLSLGIGRFLDPDTASPVLVGLLGRIDVFTIWVTVLLAIGLSVTGRIPRARAAMAAVVVWLLGALANVGSAFGSG